MSDLKRQRSSEESQVKGTSTKVRKLAYLRNIETGVLYPWTEQLSRMPMMQLENHEVSEAKPLGIHGNIHVMDFGHTEDIPVLTLDDMLAINDGVPAEKIVEDLQRSARASLQELDRWRLIWGRATEAEGVLWRKLGFRPEGHMPAKLEEYFKYMAEVEERLRSEYETELAELKRENKRRLVAQEEIAKSEVAVLSDTIADAYGRIDHLEAQLAQVVMEAKLRPEPKSKGWRFWTNMRRSR